MFTGIVYKIVCNQTGSLYVGSSEKTLEERMQRHKLDCKRWANGKYGFTTSFPIILEDDYTAEVLEVVELKGETEKARKDELRRREEYWLDIYRNLPETRGYVVNKQNAYGHNQKESNRRYYAEHRGEKIAYSKEYHANHREELNARKREKVTCECGLQVNRNSLVRHKRNSRHTSRMEEQQQQDNIDALDQFTYSQDSSDSSSE
jgi:hypothetical protein